MSSLPKPEFSRPIVLADVDESERAFCIEADDAERAALARRFELISLDRLRFEGCLARLGNGPRYRLRARLIAAASQTCVVTLAPVASEICTDVEQEYEAAAQELGGGGGEVVLAGDEESFVEPLVGDSIDVGEAAAEQLGLELEPFPRAKGATFGGYSLGDGSEPPAPANPFSSLAARLAKPESGR